jgi:hypothetical protein
MRHGLGSGTRNRRNYLWMTSLSHCASAGNRILSLELRRKKECKQRNL